MSEQPGPERDPRMVVTDVDIPFARLVVFFFKAGLAAIPAAFAVWLVIALLMSAFGAIFGFGPMRMWWMMH